MNTRRASCSCGQLQLTIEGEPSRIAMCHCLECQRRTGAVISNQARFRLEQVSFAGKTTAWTRTAESGNVMTYHFCPMCGSTLFWENEGFPGHVTVAIGNFADPTFPAPTIAFGRRQGTGGSLCRPTRPPSTLRSRDRFTQTALYCGAELATDRYDEAAILRSPFPILRIRDRNSGTALGESICGLPAI
jgi:hypothetical protein